MLRRPYLFSCPGVGIRIRLRDRDGIPESRQKNDHSKRISFFRTAISPRRLLAQPMKQSVLPILSRLQGESLISPCSARFARSAVLHRPLARSAHWRPNLSSIGVAGAAANLASPRSLADRLYPHPAIIETWGISARSASAERSRSPLYKVSASASASLAASPGFAHTFCNM